MPTLKPYPAYADTDLPWLPKIPKHWDVKRLKQVADVAFSSVDKHSKEDEQPVSLCNYVDVYKNDHITSGIEFMQATASAEEVRKFTLKKDDVMITKDSESWNDIAVPAYVPEDLENVICGYHLALVRPNAKEVDGKFLFRALQARPVSYQFEVEATGITRYGIDQYAIGSTFFPIPPLPEQRTIAAYLDRQTAKVDALIAKKQRLLDLLAEQRAALINRVVTKGLNPTVKMKDSGVAWLGKVPSHWEVKSLKRLTEIVTGNTPSKLDEDNYADGVIPWIKPDDLNGTTPVHETKEKLSEKGLKLARLIPKGSALVCCIGTVGKLGVAGLDVATNQQINSIIFSKPHIWLQNYGKYALLASENEHKRLSNKVVVAILNKTGQGNIMFPIPPIQEQIEISDYIDQQTKRLYDLTTKIETAIERLQEYRTALISSVVTGKVQVK